MSIQDATSVQAQELYQQSLRVRQGLQPYGQGSAVPDGPQASSYPAAQVDTWVQGFVDQAAAIGFNGPAPAPDPDVAEVQDGASVPVTNSQGDSIEEAVVSVADSAVTRVALPATVAAVWDGFSLTVGGATYTFTVVNGEIDSIAVS